MYVNVQGLIWMIPDMSLDYETQTQYNLTVRVSDNRGLSSTGVLTVDIGDVNEYPVIINVLTYVEINEDKTGEIFTVNAFDPEGQTLVYTLYTDNGVRSPFTVNSAGIKYIIVAKCKVKLQVMLHYDCYS